jgi:hypothetical protein
VKSLRGQQHNVMTLDRSCYNNLLVAHRFGQG